jgi:hypothetical protein
LLEPICGDKKDDTEQSNVNKLASRLEQIPFGQV